MVTRRRFLVATAGVAVAMVAVGCGETSKEKKTASTGPLAVAVDGSAERLLTEVGRAEPDEFFSRYIFALTLAGRASEIRLKDGRSASEFLDQPLVGNKQAMLTQINRVSFVELAAGQTPSRPGLRTELQANLVNDAAFANDNGVMLNTAVLNRILGDNGWPVPDEVSTALTDQLLRNRQEEGWSCRVQDPDPKSRPATTRPTVDNNAAAILAGIEQGPNLIDRYGRQGAGWVQFINYPLRQKTNVATTVTTAWGRGILAPEGFDFVLSQQKSDGGFAAEEGDDESNTSATAEVLVLLSAKDHPIFGRYLDTQKFSLGVSYLSAILFCPS